MPACRGRIIGSAKIRGFNRISTLTHLSPRDGIAMSVDFNECRFCWPNDRLHVPLWVKRVLLLLFFVFAMPIVAATAQQEKPEDVLVAAVRTEGFVCDAPLAARRDTAHPSGDGSVWILTCKSAVYRVKLIPHRAAQIERINSPP